MFKFKEEPLKIESSNKKEKEGSLADFEKREQKIKGSLGKALRVLTAFSLITGVSLMVESKVSADERTKSIAKNIRNVGASMIQEMIEEQMRKQREEGKQAEKRADKMSKIRKEFSEKNIELTEKLAMQCLAEIDKISGFKSHSEVDAKSNNWKIKDIITKYTKRAMQLEPKYAGVDPKYKNIVLFADGYLIPALDKHRESTARSDKEIAEDADMVEFFRIIEHMRKKQ